MGPDVNLWRNAASLHSGRDGPSPLLRDEHLPNPLAGPGRTAGVPGKPAARYFPDFFLRAAQYAVIRSDTAFFSSGVI